jgi:hypothetical protein
MNPPPFVRLFEKEATPILRRDFMVTRCVNATRICLDVMALFNVRAVPLSVQAIAMNKTYRQKLDKLGRFPTGEELKLWIDEGAYALGVDIRDSATSEIMNAWGGHLVTIVQDWLVDGSAIQMNRPQHGIELPDIFVGETTRRFLKGKAPIRFASDGGAMLCYTARLEDESWKTLPGFDPHPYNAEASREIAGRMARAMGCKSSSLYGSKREVTP